MASVRPMLSPHRPRWRKAEEVSWQEEGLMLPGFLKADTDARLEDDGINVRVAGRLLARLLRGLALRVWLS